MNVASMLDRKSPKSLRPTPAEQPISKRAVALVGIAALIGGVVLGLGINKMTGPKRVAEPTIAPVQAPRGNNPVGAGPSRFEGMVPVGYLHNEAGAVAAAAAFTAMTTELVFRPEYESRAAARSIAVPEAADAVELAIQTPIAGIRQGFALAGTKNPNGRALVRSTPIGTKLVSYTPEAARVDVWTVSLYAVELGDSASSGVTANTQAIYTMTSWVLVWSNGDWHVAVFKSSPDAGPALQRTAPQGPTEFINGASAFTPFRYQPKQGG